MSVIEKLPNDEGVKYTIETNNINVIMFVINRLINAFIINNPRLDVNDYLQVIEDIITRIDYKMKKGIDELQFTYVPHDKIGQFEDVFKILLLLDNATAIKHILSLMIIPINPNDLCELASLCGLTLNHARGYNKQIVSRWLEILLKIRISAINSDKQHIADMITDKILEIRRLRGDIGG